MRVGFRSAFPQSALRSLFKLRSNTDLVFVKAIDILAAPYLSAKIVEHRCSLPTRPTSSTSRFSYNILDWYNVRPRVRNAK